jgi:drug/metabolite transporter (DMT)-like permease
VTVAFGLIAAAMWAAADVLNQQVARRAGSLAALWAVLVLVLPLAIVLALVTDGLPTTADARPLGAAVLAGILDAAALGLFLRALRDGDLAIVGPLAALEGGFAAIGSVLLGADLARSAAIGIPLAVIGGALAAMSGRARLDRGAGAALGAAVVFAAVLLLLQTAAEAGAMTAVAVSRVASVACVAPFAARAGIVRVPAPIRRAALGAGIVDVLGFAAYTHAAHIGSLAVAAVAASQFATITVIVGVVALGERPRRHQWVGIALTLVGVAILAYGAA